MRPLVALLLLVLLQPAAALELDRDQQRQILSRLQRELSERYIEVTRVAPIIQAIEQFSRADDADLLAATTLSEKLTRVLRKFDQHLGVTWIDPDAVQRPVAGESWFSRLDRQNSGFRRIEILDGNIAYIEFWGFDQVSERSKSRLAAAMAATADTEALILDLRSNGGGSGEMVALISSYLLPTGVHLNSMYQRASDSATEFWTQGTVTGERRLDVPVYVLISGETFSAAEEFAYNLKHLKRATIIGEPSRGGANPWQFFELGMGFRAAIPIAKAVNPVTGGNWEGVGVEPDISATHEDALRMAHRAALETLRQRSQESRRREELQDILKMLPMPAVP